ncbi:MAG TPA: HIT domain-containing protein [Anaerolineales bacterium]|nr:HIT domain-containing protein [Anaerolineales bacterium]
MNHLWSPWRMTYIEKHKNEEGCVFCTALEAPDGPDNLIIDRRERTFIILNRYPYTSGHLMVVPYQHTPTLEGLDHDTLAEIMELTVRSTRVLGGVYHPQGFNIGINLGEAAGAGITDHVHLHVVPRWAGDTNFMSSLGQTRVLPETLEDTYQRVKGEWHA